MENNTLYGLNTKGKVLYVRHGETYYNQESKKNKSLLVKTNPIYIDSNLTPQGIFQAKEVSKIISQFTLNKVYSSPLFRCLQTTYYALKDHPDVSSIVVYIHPLLFEIVGNIQDWNHDTKGKKEKFNMNSKVKFDWSMFDSYYKDDIKRELFCIAQSDLIDDSYNKLIKEMEDLFNKDSKNELAIKTSEIVMEGIINRKELKFETMNHVFRRNIEFKQLLLKDINSSSSLNDDGKIIVFIHSGVAKIATSQSAYTMDKIIGFPKDVYEMKNCECISMNINESNCTFNN